MKFSDRLRLEKLPEIYADGVIRKTAEGLSAHLGRRIITKRSILEEEKVYTYDLYLEHAGLLRRSHEFFARLTFKLKMKGEHEKGAELVIEAEKTDEHFEKIKDLLKRSC